MKMIIIEGSASEIAEFHARSGSGLPVIVQKQEEAFSPPEVEVGEIENVVAPINPHAVSYRCARSFLSQANLPKKAKKVIKVLYDHYPDTVSASEIRSQLGGISHQALGGIIGGMGLRRSSVKGGNNGEVIFKLKDENGENHYMIPETVHRAINSINLFSA